MRETQESWVTLWNGLKYHFQLKTKEDVGERWGAVMGGYEEKHNKQGYDGYADLNQDRSF